MSIAAESNIIDLVSFRSKKMETQSAEFNPLPPTFPQISPHDLSNHIDNIKLSIKRINKLMEELKSISHKTEH